MELTSTYKKHFFLPNVNLNGDNNPEYSIAAVNCFSTLVSTAKKNSILNKNIVWVCEKCGHTHIGNTSPSSCPICNSNYTTK